MANAADEKYVYILLTRTDTVLSRLIGACTHTQYTHAALSLDQNLNKLYSFGRIWSYFPFYGGFKHEDVDTGVYGRNFGSPCALYKLKVSTTSYDIIRRRIDEIAKHCKSYHYNIIGLFGNYIGITLYRDNKYFCSEFVADTLVRSDALKLSCPPSLIKPNDFASMPELKLVFRGTLGTLAKMRDKVIAV